MSRTWTIPVRIFVSPPGVRGCSSMVEPLPSKQITRVRFPSSAPALGKPRADRPGAFALRETTGLKDRTCWFCGDFSAFSCGKINIEGGCFIVGV